MHDADVTIQEQRSAALFGVCDVDERHGLMNYGCCEFCNPEEFKRREALAIEAARVEREKRQAEFAAANKPNADMASLLETRRDAGNLVSLCRALRDGTASYLQIKLARRLTHPRALKRAARKQ